jgi:protein transport protein SEC61 subunit gamma-like protein
MLRLSLHTFLENCRRLLKLATKPDREELTLSLKICAIGVTIIGLIGFIIRFISAMLQGFTTP